MLELRRFDPAGPIISLIYQSKHYTGGFGWSHWIDMVSGIIFGGLLFHFDGGNLGFRRISVKTHSDDNPRLPGRGLFFLLSMCQVRNHWQFPELQQWDKSWIWTNFCKKPFRRQPAVAWQGPFFFRNNTSFGK